MTDISEKVDQVADAMRRSRPNNPDVPWAEFARELPFYADEWRREARMAIEALREPTEAMMEAFASASPAEWRAAIDAALGKTR